MDAANAASRAPLPPHDLRRMFDGPASEIDPASWMPDLLGRIDSKWTTLFLDGNIMTQLLGSSADEEATSMYVTDYGNYPYVGGNSRGDLMGQSNAGQRDGFLFKYIDTSGPPSSPG